ncbi:MAG: S9 family peptidase, partial [Gemmatimonadetes bacterium]|nr:S9 family peptidase [Gemmatimonadota bacterium]
VEGEARVLIDPNTLSEDGTIALSYLDYSPDGNFVAYSLTKSGSDWQTFYVRNVDTGEDFEDKLEWVKFILPAWTGDSRGFFYGRYDAPTEGDEYEEQVRGMRLFYHEVGTPQAKDVLIYKRSEDAEIGFEPFVTDDGRYLVVRVWKGSARKYEIAIADLRGDDWTPEILFGGFEARYEFLGGKGDELYFLTDRDAPNMKLIAVDATNEEPAPREIVSETVNVIKKADYVGGQFLVEHLVDATSRLTLYGPDGGTPRAIELPALGTVRKIYGSANSTHFVYSFMSFTYPLTLYSCDLATGKSRVFKKSDVDIDPSSFVISQEFYESKDGTRVPLFIVHRKDIARDGTNPTYLHGYGGFSTTQTPSFSTSRLAWVEMGGVFALACLRGGGEYGRAWHEAGMLDKKQNTFDDFIAAGEHLIREGYTSTPKLAIGGGSNGGLLAAVCAIQRPDLFRASLIAVGVLDMLRFQKFTIGWAWTSDYGSAEIPEQFPALYAYSPLHNLVKGTHYPSLFITTGDHDDRVVPSHSFKFAAAAQEAQGGENPILIRIERDAGHGRGKPTSKVIDEIGDTWAFLLYELGEKGDGI